MDAVSGALLVDKPVGPTSHDMVARVRKAAGTRRVGHAGTLDPFASGLLILLLGKATRLSEHLLGLDKEYEATARLGVETASADPEGEVVRESQDWKLLSRDQVAGALDGFRGKITQVPPVYSSKKIRGEAAHRRVRRGEVVEMKEVEVTIHDIQLLSVDLPLVRFRIRCSSGTYVRAVGRDLGRSLDVGAHLTGLRRTEIGGFSVTEALAPEFFDDPEVWRAKILAPARAVAHLPALPVNSREAERLRQGQEIPFPNSDVSPETPVRILLDDTLVGIGFLREGRLRPKRVLDLP